MSAEASDSELSFSLKGRLLLASPALSDGVFDRSVILLADHSADGGAIGSILNHPTGSTVGDFLHDPAFSPLRSLPVRHGGPLATGQLSFSSITRGPRNTIRYQHQISADKASGMVGSAWHIVHATIGHSAWSPGQLENELTVNTWITLRATHSLLSHPHDHDLWRHLLKSISPYHHLLSEAPGKPFLN